MTISKFIAIIGTHLVVMVQLIFLHVLNMGPIIEQKCSNVCRQGKNSEDPKANVSSPIDKSEKTGENCKLQIALKQPTQLSPSNQYANEGEYQKRRFSFRSSSKPTALINFEAPRRFSNAKITTQILALQEHLREEVKPEERVNEVQKLILSKNITYAEETTTNLIIGVDATPATQAGYCINLREKTLQYYVIKREDLPWSPGSETYTAEFEMKNFTFALTIWSEEILKSKRIAIYTDHRAVAKREGKFGKKAANLLDHYLNCKGVWLMNREAFWVNRFKNLESYAQFIQPADDLSRWNISEAIEFLMEFYEISKGNVRGTHEKVWHEKSPMNCIKRSSSPAAQRKMYHYTPNLRHRQILQEIPSKINLFRCSNSTCSVKLMASWRSMGI